MLDPKTTISTSLSLEAARQIDAACDRFESAWQSGERPRIEDYLEGLAPQTSKGLLAELLGLELDYRRQLGEIPQEADYSERFPDHAEVIAAAFRTDQTLVSPRHPPPIAGYDVLEIIGRGGMSVVYKAHQKSLNRVVALKVLPAGMQAGPDVAARFRVEAEAIARLQHPNIVQIYEAGECNGVPYYAMEYIDGPTLSQVLRDGPMAPTQAAECLEQVARAVQYAHAHGVLHRDLKPANVLLADVPKIADFGLAKVLNSRNELTVTGQVLGTPTYMAPEQVRGAPSGVGPASDVYSLGAVLYAALTGQPPFRGQTVYATMTQVADDEPPPPRSLGQTVPRDLETICLKCLHKDPLRRYATAQELADDLRRWLNGEMPVARRAGRVERMMLRLRRNPLAVMFFALWLLTLLALFVALALLVASYGRAPPGASSNPASTRRVSSIRPALRWAYAASMASHRLGVNGTASFADGTLGTSRRTMAAHNSGIPAPVRTETRTGSTV